MNKTLVITGGSKGIGRATIEQFLDADYKVINLSRSDIGSEEIHQLCVDLSDAGWAKSIKEDLLQLTQNSDEICVVHCAALLLKDSVRDLPQRALAEVFQVNVSAAVQLNQLLLPLMNYGSSIIYVGSTLSEKAVANSCSYVVSKHALVGLMRSTCQDLAGSGIHTACVCPGFTDTEMLRAHLGNDNEVLKAVADGVSFGRLVDPAEIASLIYFCAGNPVINGDVLHANLGQIES